MLAALQTHLYTRPKEPCIRQYAASERHTQQRRRVSAHLVAGRLQVAVAVDGHIMLMSIPGRAEADSRQFARLLQLLAALNSAQHTFTS